MIKTGKSKKTKVYKAPERFSHELLKIPEIKRFKEKFKFEPIMHRFPLTIGKPIIMNLNKTNIMFGKLVAEYNPTDATYNGEKKISPMEFILKHYGSEGVEIFEDCQ